MNLKINRRGFTIIELLTVVGIIVVLVGLLVVAVSSASKVAQAASTRSMMGAVSRALTQFKTDMGYLPPVLGFPTTGASQTGSVGYLRDLVLPPNLTGGPTPSQVTQIQNYYSMTSMVEYLIGPGGRDEDGYGAIGIPANTTQGFKELPPAGIRSPLKDGVWGAYSNPGPGNQTLGNFSRRNLPQGSAANTSTVANVSGRVLGPYLELKDGSLLGAIVGTDSVTGQPIVARAGDNNWKQDAPKVLLDYYGQPIRFYRKGYVNGDPKRIGGKRVGEGTATDVGWDLSDIFVLRPQRFDLDTGIEDVPENRLVADGNGDNSTTRSLRMADFALFSSGPDQRADFTVRRDATLFNEDNIVEVGN